MARSLFFKPRSKRIARIITIRNPAAFRRGMKILMQDGLTLSERRALILAKNRARVILRRTDLSSKEVRQMTEISRVRIPPLKR